MVGASLYIAVCSTRNRIRLRLRRLREPRYLVGAILGAAFGFAAAREVAAGARRAAAAGRRAAAEPLVRVRVVGVGRGAAAAGRAGAAAARVAAGLAARGRGSGAAADARASLPSSDCAERCTSVKRI